MGETNFQNWEFPQSGSKAKDVKEERREKKKTEIGNNNGQLPIANTTSGGARKPPGPKEQESEAQIRTVTAAKQ